MKEHAHKSRRHAPKLRHYMHIPRQYSVPILMCIRRTGMRLKRRQAHKSRQHVHKSHHHVIFASVCAYRAECIVFGTFGTTLRIVGHMLVHEHKHNRRMDINIT